MKKVYQGFALLQLKGFSAALIYFFKTRRSSFQIILYFNNSELLKK